MKHGPKREWLLVILILSVATFFRLYQLHQYPPGLYPDEAMDGSNALIANTTGHYQIFYTENNGREGLYIDLQALSVKYFGNTAWALRVVSAIIGILTVLGLYLLARELFDWQIGAISSFLLAISFWHVNFSRIGFDGIMVPFILVFLFYFLWKGLKSSRLVDFFWAGVFSGLGFYTYSAYRLSPLIFIFLFINYWIFLRKDYGHENYTHARGRLAAGISLFLLTTFFVALPMGWYFLNHPDQLTERSSQVSVLSQAQPLQQLASSVVKTLGMFTFTGDFNPRDNIPGQPMLGWPIAIFFAIGILKEAWHWLSRKHGHLSPVHTLMFSWFFVMLLPGFLSTEAPHALRTIGVLPIVMIFAARGIWTFFNLSESWESITHPWEKIRVKNYLAPSLALLALLVGFGFYEYHRYFDVFGPAQVTQEAFNQDYVDVADQINALPTGVKKYVIVTAGGVEALGLPVPAETVMYLTDTPTPETQKAKNLVYLTGDQAKHYHFTRQDHIFYVK